MPESYHVHWRGMATVAYVVSAHGFGHAARSCAVMNAMARLRDDLEFEIITRVPDWFFAQSLTVEHRVYPLETDVGMVQRNTLEEDLEATVELLERLLASREAVIEAIASHCRSSRCRVVVCDIAPLGLVAARRHQLPSVLVENFTWDWIYRGYHEPPRGLARHADTLAAMFRLADTRIQTEPACQACDTAHTVAPVSRDPRTPAAEVRDRLGVPWGARLVLLTMGGIRWDWRSLEAITAVPGARFVVPGGDESPRREGSLVRLPFHSDFYHPDLVHAADLVVGKLGYSTVAEAYHAHTALAYLARPRFPESGVLERFAISEMGATALATEAFSSGAWLEQLEGLLGGSQGSDMRRNGAADAARIILELM